MKFTTKFFCHLFVLITFNCSAQTFSPEQIHKDMRILKEKLVKYHPELYAYISQKNYQKLYDSLYAATNKPMNKSEAFRQIAPLVIAIQDGHTSIGKPKENRKMLPIYIRKLQENGTNTSYFITANCSNDTTLLRGTEIFSVNNLPMKELFGKLTTLVSADNYNETSRLYYVQAAFPNFYHLYFGTQDSVKISYRLLGESTIRDTKLACLSDKEIEKKFIKRYKWVLRGKNLDLKLMDSSTKTAKLDISSFLLMRNKLDLNNGKFKRILRNDFKKIKEIGVENLIIDLRGNGGGYVPNISRLLAYLLPKPFTLIDTLAFKKSSYLKIAAHISIVPPLFLWAFFPKRQADLMFRVNKSNEKHKIATNLHFNGKVYFLINEGCYSATVFTAVLAKDKRIGTFIGEEIGGASWGSHAVNMYKFKLPNTKIRIDCPLFRLTHKLTNKPQDFFLQPDFTVGRNYEELRKNNDNVLDFTLKMIRQSSDFTQK